MKRILVVTAAALAVSAAPAHATLAYVKGLLSGKPVLYVAADDGSGARTLVRGGFHPRVSPDGTQVAYLTGTRRVSLIVRPVAGGPGRTVARGVWNFDAIRWSPDGLWLTVVTGPELGPYKLRLISLAGAPSRTLARGAFHGVSFAPDGSALVWSRAPTSDYPIEADLYSAPLAGGAPVALTDDGNATAPVWGPERIAFTRGRRPERRGDYEKLEVFTILPDGSGRRRLTKTDPPFLIAGLSPLAWSDDGRRLLATYGGQDTSEAYRIDPATGRESDVTGADDGVVGWDLSGDGTAVLGTTGGFDSPSGNVVAVSWDTGAQTVLARRATQPSWSR